MKKSITINILRILPFVFLTACGNLTEEAEKRLNELNKKAESLDSFINKEVNKVISLDSLIDTERKKVKILDSLINKSSSKIDSIAKKGSKLLEKITN